MRRRFTARRRTRSVGRRRRTYRPIRRRRTRTVRPLRIGYRF